MPKFADLLGVFGSTFTIGSKALTSGVRRLAFRSGSFLGTLSWNLTANQNIDLPNASGTVLLNTTATIAGSIVVPVGVTTIDWAIPAGVRRITLVTSDVPITSGSVVRFGTSGGILSTGYNSCASFSGLSIGVSGSNATVGFLVPHSGVTSNCCLVFTRGAGNTWSMSGLTVQSLDYFWVGVGSRNLPGELTTFRYVSPVTLNAGSLQLLWEY